jgi:molybdopterin-containing oxidoreductase family iron-sulfur binding subunit
MDPLKNSDCQNRIEDSHPQDKQCGRREFLKGAARVAAMGGAAMLTGCGTEMFGSKEERSLQFKEFFKKNYRMMTQEEKEETVRRLERLAKIQNNVNVQISSKEPIEGVLFGYAFNVTRCEGYMECVAACVKENNLDRKTNTQYIRIFEMEHGQMSPEAGDGKFLSRPAPQKPPGKSKTESWWSTMTGASAAGIVWQPAPITGADSTGTIRKSP